MLFLMREYEFPFEIDIVELHFFPQCFQIISNETLKPRPLAILLRRQYDFPFGINIVEFSIQFSVFKTFIRIYPSARNMRLLDIGEAWNTY